MPLKISCLIILSAILPGVILQLYNEGYVTKQCEEETTRFTENEDQYIDSQNRYGNPDLNGRENKVLQQRVYEKEKKQRIFECISNKLNEFSNGSSILAPEYQNLVLQCKFGQPLTQCDPLYPYRTIDGSCNNLLNPKWGSVQTCARRLLPAGYEGVSGIRKSVCGINLPEPRMLSLKLFKNTDSRSPTYTNMFIFFAQIVTHDMTDTPVSNIRTQRIDCCSNPFHQHPQCAPILLREDDPFYSKLNITCFNFVRAAPCVTCSLGKRNQMIEVTSYIDSSFIYGLTETDARDLRRNDGTGKLLSQYREAGELLPPDYNAGTSCGSSGNSEYCFKSGDRRLNQHTPLSSLHTIFMREHNRVADKLKELNPNWDEETLYQEARKIVVAELQVIVFNEYLPSLLGSDLMSAYQLWINKDGRSVYNPYVDSTLMTEFNTAAFRLHTMISGLVTYIAVDGGKYKLSDFYGNSSAIYHGEMGLLLEGICLTGSQTFGGHATKETTEVLYKTQRVRYGFDLEAIDIQRGRDNGVPPYVEVLRYLTGGKIDIQDFDGLYQVLDPEKVNLMKTIYCDVRDIDFYVGMHYERVSENMTLGPSAAIINAMQFHDLKFGDRFYFEHFGVFNDNQLRTLKEVTLSKLLCDNSNIATMQENAMVFPSLSNPIKLCSEIPGLNLNFWKVLY